VTVSATPSCLPAFSTTQAMYCGTVNGGDAERDALHAADDLQRGALEHAVFQG